MSKRRSRMARSQANFRKTGEWRERSGGVGAKRKKKKAKRNWECSCGSHEFLRTKQIFKNGTEHVRIDCKNCGVFVGWEAKASRE